MLKISISPGNTKLGRTPNLSLLPGVTCHPDVPCRKACYAYKACKSYVKSVVPCWATNTLLWNMEPEEFWRQVRAWFEKRRRNPPGFFRWFVAGDLPSPGFLYAMAGLAGENPETRFLFFTKRVDMVPHARVLPRNLVAWYSAWPGYGDQQLADARQKCIPVAWYQPKVGRDVRMPVETRHCPKHCEKCRSCWSYTVGPPDLVLPHH